ncbi:hypothetical protein D9M68_18120 [compost metagenome]
MKKTTVVLAQGEGYVSDETLRKLVEKSNSTGYLAELGMPKLIPGASPQEVMDQYNRINHQRVCAKITNIRRSEDGMSVVGDVEPYGPMEKVVKKSLQSGGENLGFSIRSIQKNMKKEIVTYDLTKF